MRPQAHLALCKFLKDTSTLGPIYEFGSLQVDPQYLASNLRPLFPKHAFVGCDMRPGLGVDLILDVEKIALPDKSVGMVIMLDTLEHVQRPVQAMDECYRILKPGGHIFISSVMRFPIHDYPLDYWRFTPAAFSFLLRKFKVSGTSFDGQPAFPTGVYGWGTK